MHLGRAVHCHTRSRARRAATCGSQPDDWQAVVSSAIGSGSITFNVPNVTSLVGISVFHQWLVSDPAANSLGVVASGAAKTRIGG